MSLKRSIEPIVIDSLLSRDGPSLMARLGIVVVLAFFSFQALGLDGVLNLAPHKSTSTPYTEITSTNAMSHCHGEMSAAEISGKPIESAGKENKSGHNKSGLNCCEDGCSMSNCHAGSAIIAMPLYLALNQVFNLDVQYLPSPVTSSIESLYRPPIIA